MDLIPDRIGLIGKRIIDEGLVDRHRQQTRQLYNTIYGFDELRGADDKKLEIVFKRTIQARANPIGKDEYDAIIDDVKPNEILDAESREDAFQKLLDVDYIGQKIANEFLRQSVHVFELNKPWINSLEVPLDTHVVQGLIKTGAISLDSGEEDRRPGQIINMKPGSKPTKRIGYDAVQDCFRDTADNLGHPPIIFDELWLEHRHFLNDELLQQKSEFLDLLHDKYRV